MKDIDNTKFKKTKYEYHDNIIDIWARDFNSHPKGMAEWFKNSLDAYDRGKHGIDDKNVIFRFTTKNINSIECIDFVGMTKDDLDNAFKIWGDPDASKRGQKIDTLGGHGNGGKLYMYAMFNNSFFITYKDGLLNRFGFMKNKDSGHKDYGYYEQDKKCSPEEALKFSNIEGYIELPDKLKQNILSGKQGFTCVRGIDPKDFSSRKDLDKISKEFSIHSQAIRYFSYANVSIIFNNDIIVNRITAQEPKRHALLPEDIRIDIPKEIEFDGDNIATSSSTYKQGTLILKTLADPLKGKKRQQGGIVFLAKNKVIAHYDISSLSVTEYPWCEYIYGDCDLPFLASGGSKYIKNDRESLVSAPLTEALKMWVASQVDKIAAQIGEVIDHEKDDEQNQKKSETNKIFNDWFNEIYDDIFSEDEEDGLDDLPGDNNSNEPGGKGKKGKGSKGKLTEPLNGFAFSRDYWNIVINQEEYINFKATVPVGTAIRFEMSNLDTVGLVIKEHIVSDDNMRKLGNLEIAVVRIPVIGNKFDEVTLQATSGNRTASTKITVVASKGAGKGKFQVLLSSIDPDPLNKDKGRKSLILSERDPIIYQRRQDVEARIYWINTSSPLASRINKIYSFSSSHGKIFLFERYLDIMTKEVIYSIDKNTYDSFNVDTVDQQISQAALDIHRMASEKVGDFLL